MWPAWSQIGRVTGLRFKIAEKVGYVLVVAFIAVAFVDLHFHGPRWVAEFAVAGTFLSGLPTLALTSRRESWGRKG